MRGQRQRQERGKNPRASRRQEEVGVDSCLENLEGAWSWWHLDIGLWPPEWWQNTFLLCDTTRFVVICYGCPINQIHWGFSGFCHCSDNHPHSYSWLHQDSVIATLFNFPALPSSLCDHVLPAHAWTRWTIAAAASGAVTELRDHDK